MKAKACITRHHSQSLHLDLDEADQSLLCKGYALAWCLKVYRWQILETVFITCNFSRTDYCCCGSWNGIEIPNKSAFIVRAILLSRITLCRHKGRYVDSV